MEFFGIAIILYIAYKLMFRFFRKIESKESKEKFLIASRNCKYKIFHEQTGVAINPEDQKIILANNNFVKEYSFDDIREWETSLRSGGTIFNPSIADRQYNKMQIENNKTNTGIAFYVKDINHARWFVKFPYHEDTRDTLAQWHEILNQYIGDRMPE